MSRGHIKLTLVFSFYFSWCHVHVTWLCGVKFSLLHDVFLAATLDLKETDMREYGLLDFSSYSREPLRKVGHVHARGNLNRMFGKYPFTRAVSSFCGNGTLSSQYEARAVMLLFFLGLLQYFNRRRMKWEFLWLGRGLEERGIIIKKPIKYLVSILPKIFVTRLATLIFGNLPKHQLILTYFYKDTQG